MRAFRIAYDGSPYFGFQRQPEVPTVEDALLSALSALGVADGLPAGYAASGRTDRGVSALAQTVSFECPEWLTPAAFNSELPADVRAWASTPVGDDFHARYDAESRAYVYHLHAPEFDDGAVSEALSKLAREHDFHNLTPETERTERALYDASAARNGPFLTLRFRGDSFCRHQIRRTATLLAEIGSGERDAGSVDRVLSPESLSGGEGIGAAPAEALVLTDVSYPDTSFEVDPEAAESARAVFETKRVERETAARVAGTVSEGIGE
ncbi:tRNA pseudouridine(38-40) synthase TruA [Natronorarus salvus]|uniref:tRNA pseudouridine(38-40) synthase TruA n=1 Tax=Natronorarus salvus TaxID=3117733 RepID=UPI002F2657C6